MKKSFRLFLVFCLAFFLLRSSSVPVTGQGEFLEFPVNLFERVATYDVSGVVAEIVTATPDGRTLIYTDADSREVGFVNITNPAAPVRGNYDLEGISVSRRGGFWAVSEGAGNAGGSGLTKNLLLYINTDGSIGAEVELPASVNAQQRQFGYEGVATNSNESQIYVAFQREWGDDPAGLVKIGRYTPTTGEWRFYHYPIDAAPAVSGAWVGLSELVRIDNTTFAVLERDNQRRKNALVKKIYLFSISGIDPVATGATPPRLTKTLVRDLLLQDDWRIEKAEGLARLRNGNWYVVSDNDGAGETRLLNLGKIVE